MQGAEDDIRELIERPPENVNAADTSDNHLQKFDLYRQIVAHERMGFLYTKWTECLLSRKSWNAKPWGEGFAEKELLPELGGLNWGHIYDLQARLATMSKVGENLKAGARGAHSELDAVWKGEAADAALKKFTDLESGSVMYQASNSWLSGHVMGLWHSTREPVVDLCKLADDGRVGNFCRIYETTDDGERGKHIDDFEYFIEQTQVSNREEGLDALGWAAPASGLYEYVSYVKRIVTGDVHDLESKLANWIGEKITGVDGQRLRDAADDAQSKISWLDDYCQQYNDTINEFRARIEQTYDAVQKSFEVASEKFTSEFWLSPEKSNPYYKLAPPKDVSNPGGEQSPGPTPPGGPAGVPGGGGGGMPGGGGTSPAGVDLPKPEDLMPQEPTLPGMNPVTGKPLESNPETGGPCPIDPETGEAITDVGRDQDTVTVKKGDNEISITEPDEDGKMGITIDDGKGDPKEYNLDFGDEDEGAPHEDADGGQVYRPGPDGKIHIEDGDLKFTAERPDGPDGPTVVTVDDGKGEPTTNTVGDADGARNVGSAGAPTDSRPSTASEIGKPAPSGSGTAGFGGSGGGSATDGSAQATHPQFLGGAAEAVGASVGGGAGGFGGIGDTGGVGLGDTSSLEAGNHFGAGAQQPAGASAGLGSVPGGVVPPGPHAAGPSGESGSGMMGGGMMGGMGAGAGGADGDQERTTGAYRIDGGLFEDEIATGPFGTARISGSLDDDDH
ncbi:MAG: hypothetical protein ACRDQ7_00580 [Haloechinothrix sp.]